MTAEWTRAEYGRIAALLTETAGLDLGATRRADAEKAIVRGMRSAGIAEAEDYLTLLRRDRAAVEALGAELTVGETYILRDTAQFQLIRDSILPAIAAARPAHERIRIWSAGCATGEEAYSLAMVAHQVGVLRRTHIVATDIARARLERAHRGRYGGWSFRGVPQAVKRSYFTRDGDEYQVNASLREHVEFRYLNLLEDAIPSLSTGVWGMHLILCRNVLIYLDPPAVARVAGALVRSLAADGWLLLGASDPPIEPLTGCTVEITSAGLAYRPAREPGAATRPAPVAAAAETPTPQPLAPPVRVSRTLNGRSGLHRAPPVRTAELPGASRANADHAAAAVAAVRTLANQGRLVEAERACTRALERYPTHPELCYLHGLLLAESGQHKAAARAARQALYLDPDMVVAHLALGHALTRMGNVAAARRSYGTAERLLSALDPAAVVTASDGEPAGRLLEIARMQLQLALSGTG